LLEIGKPIEKRLAVGQTDSYCLTLTQGQYVHVVIEQKGVDVEVVLLGPDGNKLDEVDSPNGKYGTEPLSFIATVSGSYRVKVCSQEEDPGGRYEIRIADLRIATEQDQKRSLAGKWYRQGTLLQGEGIAESLPKAIEKYEEALPIFRDLGDRQSEAHILHYIGSIYIRLGEHQKGLEFSNQALPIFRDLGDRRSEAHILRNIAWLYKRLGDEQKSLEYYKQAMPIFRDLGDRDQEAFVLTTIGLAYNKLGDKQKALECFNQALLMQRSIGDRGGEAVVVDSLAVLYDSLGDKQKALEFFNQALPLRREGRDRRGEIITLNNLGRVHDSLGDKQKALEFFNQALPLWRRLGDLPGEATTLHNIARIERDRGNLTEARSYIEAALKINESLRTKIVSPALRASYFTLAQTNYEFYVDLLMRLGQRSPTQGDDAAALQASERARARSLLEMLIEARPHIRPRGGPALLQRESPRA